MPQVSHPQHHRGRKTPYSAEPGGVTRQVEVYPRPWFPLQWAKRVRG